MGYIFGIAGHSSMVSNKGGVRKRDMLELNAVISRKQ